MIHRDNPRYAHALRKECHEQGFFRLVDMYCGAGGSTAGAEEAANFVGLKCELSVWNHWAVAIETHKTNHPAARHYCENLNNVNPRDHYPKNSLHALWASPVAPTIQSPQEDVPRI